MKGPTVDVQESQAQLQSLNLHISKCSEYNTEVYWVVELPLISAIRIMQQEQFSHSSNFHMTPESGQLGWNSQKLYHLPVYL